MVLTTLLSYPQQGFLDKLANVLLTPTCYLFGKRYTLINTRTIEKPFSKSFLKTTLAIIVLIPSFFLGILLKLPIIILDRKFTQAQQIHKHPTTTPSRHRRQQTLYSSTELDLSSVILHHYTSKSSASKKLDKQLAFARQQQSQERSKGFYYQKFRLSRIRPSSFPEIVTVADTNPYIATTQGRRDYMEDVSSVNTFTINTQPAKLIILCDGHAGGEAANFVSLHFSQILQQCFSQHPSDTLTDDYITDIITQSCFDTNQQLNDYLLHNNIRDLHGSSISPGTTFLAVLTIDNVSYIINIGDSRAITLSPTTSCLQLTEDATVGNPHFDKSLLDAHHKISYDEEDHLYRVDDVLAVARNLGSPEISLPCKPKITKITSDHPLLLASDGLWKVASSQEVATATQKMLADQIPLAQIPSKLVLLALHHGSDDNITIIITTP